MVLHLTQLQRLSLVIGISLCFFLAEISGILSLLNLEKQSHSLSLVGFYTKSLALVADAFHYVSRKGFPRRSLTAVLTYVAQ